jgi:aminoglycoside 6'-N-acetyltransferase I
MKHDSSREEHLAEMTHFLTQPEQYANFVALDTNGRPVGLAEASIRSDYVNGTSGSPVGFLEGLYVVPDSRTQGIGRALVSEVSNWALLEGCVELASDTQFENIRSQHVHEALGFTETERVVYYCKTLRGTK